MRVGANKLDVLIPADYYAPERIQLNETRLHERTGLKYADGIKYNQLDISEKNLLKAIYDIQELLDIAARNENCSFDLKITKKGEQKNV